MNDKSPFLSKFKDRIQFVNKNGLISLGVHSVSKKVLPKHKSHQNLLPAPENLSSSIGFVFKPEDILTKNKKQVNLPPLRQVYKKYSQKTLAPICMKNKNLNFSFVGNRIMSPVSEKKKNFMNRNESIDVRLNKSLIFY